MVVLYTAALGVSAGAHRHWTHRTFKAKPWVKILMIYLHTVAGQNHLWTWIRDHRQHHKYSDTDADPHNASRGFWFSHIGWLCVRKHPKVLEFGKNIDMSDIEAEPLIMFQVK
jgi:stearoyl-CoA desaturase (Delta-9 desaturase)